MDEGGLINIKDALQNLLPARFKSEEVKKKLWQYTQQRLERLFNSSGLYGSNEVSLFGHSFYPAQEKTPLTSWLSTFKTISEAIIFDQYHAKEFIRENSVIIDAGANIGAFSVFAANLAPKGHVYCFEPTPGTFEILRKNTKIYPNITIFQKGLGEVAKNADLIINEDAPAANTLADSGMLDNPNDVGHYKKRVRVGVVTIDNFMREVGVDGLDFIKIDAEGYEKRILIGAKDTIKRLSPVMSMSAYHHPNDKKDLSAYVRSLDQNYKFKISRESEEDILFWKGKIT